MAPVKPNTKIRKKYSEEQLKTALEDIKSGLSIYEASKRYEIPKTTLRDKLNKKYKNPKCGVQTALTHEEEKVFVSWIIHLGKQGFPVTQSQLIGSVAKYIASTKKSNPFKNKTPGSGWFKGFMARHPELSKRVSQSLTSCKSAITQTAIEKWFATVKEYLTDSGLLDLLKDPSRIFNCDETAFFLSPVEKQVLVKKGTKHVYNRTANDEKECLTVLANVSASGDKPPPMILFPYKARLPRHLALSMPSGWGVGISESGWMNCETFYEYICNVFYPWLLQEKIVMPVILYLDGHTSHISLALNEFCKEKGIILVALLPNSTHILQPLDVAVFRAMKGEWKNIVHEFKVENNYQKLTRNDFARLVERCFNRTLRQETICNGFKACGLYPFEPNNVDWSKLITKHPQTHETIANTASRTGIVQENMLSSFEKRLSTDVLNMFRSTHDKWLGELPYLKLYEYWKDLVKEAAQRNSATDNKLAKTHDYSYTIKKHANVNSSNSESRQTNVCADETIYSENSNLFQNGLFMQENTHTSEGKRMAYTRIQTNKNFPRNDSSRTLQEQIDLTLTDTNQIDIFSQEITYISEEMLNSCPITILDPETSNENNDPNHRIQLTQEFSEIPNQNNMHTDTPFHATQTNPSVNESNEPVIFTQGDANNSDRNLYPVIIIRTETNDQTNELEQPSTSTQDFVEASNSNQHLVLTKNYADINDVFNRASSEPLDRNMFDLQFADASVSISDFVHPENSTPTQETVSNKDDVPFNDSTLEANVNTTFMLSNRESGSNVMTIDEQLWSALDDISVISANDIAMQNNTENIETPMDLRIAKTKEHKESLNINQTSQNVLQCIDNVSTSSIATLHKTPPKNCCTPACKINLTTNEKPDTTTTPEETSSLMIPTPFKKALFFPKTPPVNEKKRITKRLTPVVAVADEFIEYQRRLDVEKQKKEKERMEKALKRKYGINKCLSSKQKVTKKNADTKTATPKDQNKEDLTIHPGKKYKVGDWVVVKYEEEYFPGLILNTNSNNSTVKTMHMYKEHWKWPPKDDLLSYSNERDIISVIKQPKLLNDHDIYVVPEIELLRNMKTK